MALPPQEILEQVNARPAYPPQTLWPAVSIAHMLIGAGMPDLLAATGTAASLTERAFAVARSAPPGLQQVGAARHYHRRFIIARELVETSCQDGHRDREDATAPAGTPERRRRLPRKAQGHLPLQGEVRAAYGSNRYSWAVSSRMPNDACASTTDPDTS